MAICDVHAPLPPLEGARLLKLAELTATMQRFAQRLSDNGAIPIGHEEREWHAGKDGRPWPILARVECHDRHQNETQASGAYHGCTLYVATSPAQLARFPGDAPSSTSESGGAAKALFALGALGLVALVVRGPK